MMYSIDHVDAPVIHQHQPHFDHLVLNELMLTNLDDIGDTSIIGVLALVNLEIVVVISLTH